jgi:hypothetical protein
MTQKTSHESMSFLAKHLLGQLIKASGEYPSLVSFEQVFTDKSLPEEEQVPGSLQLVEEISGFWISDETNGVNQRFAIIERYYVDEEDGDRLVVCLTHQFRAWVGKDYFVRMFEDARPQTKH